MLRLVPLVGEGSRILEQSDPEAQRLCKAADIVLGLDAALARRFRKGRTIQKEIQPPRWRCPLQVGSAEEALTLRPRIEELVAPLLFETTPASLRPFQHAGVQWLANQRAGILADDMGLGKTVQALRALQALIESGEVGSALVICPKSLLSNWEAECNRWVPGLTVIRAAPSHAEADETWAAIHGRSHIVLTSYERLRPLPQPLATQKTDLIIVDEAHRLRKPNSGLVNAFRLIKTDRLWALTGTPLERHIEDLAVLLSLLEPGRFSVGSAAEYGVDLRLLARPYLLRRVKDDVLDELPNVVDEKETVELTHSQRRSYNAALSRPVSREAGDILQRLTRLRAICDADPCDDSSVKIDRTVEILQAICQAGEKAVVFSYLLRPLDLLRAKLTKALPHAGTALLTGELSVSAREDVIADFKSDDTVVVLLCSSRVGGEGLTLTEANHVIFLNEWWNPSANAQARDRVVRLGQKRVVHVHRFRCQDTVEEILDSILERKAEAFAKVVDALAVGAMWGEAEARELAMALGV